MKSIEKMMRAALIAQTTELLFGVINDSSNQVLISGPKKGTMIDFRRMMEGR